MSLPLWAFALMLAALAPFAAKQVATLFQGMSRSRSREWLSSTHEHRGERVP